MDAQYVSEEIAGNGRVTLGADKNYDTQDFVRDFYELKVTPHETGFDAQDTVSRSFSGRMDVHICSGRVQPCKNANACGGNVRKRAQRGSHGTLSPANVSIRGRMKPDGS